MLHVWNMVVATFFGKISGSPWRFSGVSSWKIRDPPASRWSRSWEDAALWRSWEEDEEDIHHLWPTNIFASGAVAGIAENKKRVVN